MNPAFLEDFADDGPGCEAVVARSILARQGSGLLR
jgi:hypothetical protein